MVPAGEWWDPGPAQQVGSWGASAWSGPAGQQRPQRPSRWGNDKGLGFHALNACHERVMSGGGQKEVPSGSLDSELCPDSQHG